MAVGRSEFAVDTERYHARVKQVGYVGPVAPEMRGRTFWQICIAPFVELNLAEITDERVTAAGVIEEARPGEASPGHVTVGCAIEDGPDVNSNRVATFTARDLLFLAEATR